MDGLFRMPGVGELFAGVTTGYGSKPHFHDGYSIGIFHGHARISFRGAVRLVSEEQVVVLEPGEVHGGRGDSAQCRQDGLVLEPSFVERLFGSPRPVHFAEAVVSDEALSRELSEAISDHCEAGLVSAITRLFRRYGSPVTVAQIPTETVPAVAPALSSIAAQAEAEQLSRSHYSRKVKSQLGLTPRDYRRQQRVQVARVLIEQGHDLAEAASEAGFSDQAHMTRQMRMLLGVTPGALRKTQR